ncbi:MAG: nucleoside-diphosphate sugar epimerase [Firmicutes bacterium HGW-Firmicutes-1]|jgi:FlaA1/EpsC-like NDP-sugar epimerase|nr:MAG: nucleoside-diphosphate sugar epimerase [Firmicutes bacterium HGW-Firmicutes-1]
MKIKMKMMYLVLIDIFIINFAFLFSMYMHFEGQIPSNLMREYEHIIIIILLLKIFFYYQFSLYDSLWEYASIEELMKVLGAVISANFFSIIYMIFMGFNVYPGIYIISVMVEIMLVGGLRFSYRFVRRIKHNQTIWRHKYDKNVLIIGCGSTASLVANEIKNHPHTYGQVVGYIDDDKQKLGKTIAGIKVVGNRHDIYSVSKRYGVNEIIVAVPTASKSDLKEILEESKRCDAKVRIVPGITEIIDGKVSMSKIRDVEIEDLLGRDPVDLNVHEIASYLEGKVIMVTGGGGSIGSELCRQIAKFNPKKLIILDIYENNAYEIQKELSTQYGNQLNLDVLIASVRERDTIFDIIKSNRPNVIFHAAAHKHVPLMEDSPKEAIKNNVFGTMNVAEAAHEYNVERFVLISTDKAVNPTNVMGASKRMCEMVIQGLAKSSKTKFVAVRFGNVLGSNGSVIPLFKKQISEGGPVTITHMEIIRYFMTIPEASQLVIQAGAIANGGEIFVLDMGEPVKIFDLAIDLIKLSGLEPHKDIQIEVTGLRPGEKLFEELLMEEEGLENTKYPKIFIGSSGDFAYALLKKSFIQLKEELAKLDIEELKEYIKRLVPTYTYVSESEIEIEKVLNISDENLKPYKVKNH